MTAEDVAKHHFHIPGFVQTLWASRGCQESYPCGTRLVIPSTNPVKVRQYWGADRCSRT